MDKTELLEIIKYAERQLAPRDDRIRRYRSLYNMDHYSPDAEHGLPPIYHRVINQYSYSANDATNVVDLTTGILSHNALRLTAFTYGESKESNARAGRIERLCSALLNMNSIEQEVDIHHDVVHNAAIDGGVGVRCIWVDEGLAETAPQSQPEHPSALQRLMKKVPAAPPHYLVGNPLRLNVIPLINLVYLPGGPKGRWLMVALRDERTLHDVRTEFPDYRPEVTIVSAMETKCKFYDVWLWDNGVVCNAIVVDNDIVRPVTPMDGYDSLPYTVVFFRPNQDKSVANWGLSSLFTIEDDIRLLETRISHQSRMLDIWANLPLMSKTRDGRPIDVDAVFGKVINLGADESIGFVQPGSEPPDHDKIIGYFKQSISNGSFPPVTYGQGAGVASGYGLSQLAEGGRIRLEQPKRQIELLWQIVFHKALALFQRFAPDKGLQVFGQYRGESFVMRDLVGSDTTGWMMAVQLDPHFPQDEARMVALGNQMLALKAVSRRTVQEKYYGIDDPDREADRILTEAFEQNPQVAQMLILQAAKDYGYELPEQTAQPPSQPRQPISQPWMGNPEQGVLPPQAVGEHPPGQGNTPGDAERVLAALTGQGG